MRTNPLTRSAVLAGVLLTGGAATALADDLFPPPWRGQGDTTFQEFAFLPSNSNGPTLANNPFGPPQMFPGGGFYTVTAPGSSGLGFWVLHPGQTMQFYIPNSNEPPPHTKEVYIQVTFIGSIDVSVTDNNGNSFGNSTTTTTPQPAPNGGSYQSFDFSHLGCPLYEIISLTNPSPVNDLYIDQVVIDTICRVPTPGTGAALGLGLLAAARRRRV